MFEENEILRDKKWRRKQNTDFKNTKRRRTRENGMEQEASNKPDRREGAGSLDEKDSRQKTTREPPEILIRPFGFLVFEEVCVDSVKYDRGNYIFLEELDFDLDRWFVEMPQISEKI